MKEIILTSSVLILLLAVLRRALRGRIHPGVQYALWLLVAARLLIPGALFPAPVSVMGAAEELRTTILAAETAPVGQPVQTPADGPSASIVTQPADGPSAPFVAQKPDGPSAAFQMKPVGVVQTENILQWIWMAGMAVTGGVMAASNLVFYLRLRKTRKRLILPAAPWTGKLPVYEAEGLTSPCLFGLFRPAIYLNEAAMETEHPEHILAHEYAHYRHGDHLWSILRSVCLVVHWYNPLVWWAAELSRRDCELACDAAALRRLGEADRIDYGQTLLGMVSRRATPAALLHTATTMTAGKRAMTERIALIVKRPRMRKITLALVAVLTCLLAACTFGGGEVKTPGGTEPSPGPEGRTPVAVAISQSASSNSNDGAYITDPAEVARLWELYQSFEYEGTYDPTGMGGWPILVSFLYGDTPDDGDTFFILSQHGLYNEDGENLRLKDIDAIYAEFLRLARTEPTAPDSLEPAEADALAEVLVCLDELRGEDVVGYNFSSKLGAPANGGYSPESILPVLEEAFRACRWTKVEEHPETDEYVVGDIRESSIARMEDYPYWNSVTVGPFTFYDGHSYAYCGKTDEWYYVPEGWVTVQAALQYDTDTAHTLEEKKAMYLYDAARNEWNSVQFGWMFARYTGMFETEEGSWPSVGFFESVEDFRGYLETMFSPELAEYLLSMHPLREKDGRLHFLSGDLSASIYAGEETCRVFPMSAEEAAQYGYDGHIFAQTPVLGEDLETVLGYKRHDYFYTWNGTHYVFTNFGPYDDVDPQVYYNADEIVAQVQQGADPAEWLSLLTYMDWQAVARAAVNAGMDDGDGSGAVVDVIGAIDRYIDRQGPSMTQAEYLSLLSATEGLDGAPAEGYAGALYRLYAVNPSQFAYVVLEQLPEAQQNAALDLFRFEWHHHRVSTGPAAPTREEAIEQLEADLAVGVSATPSEMTLEGEGHTFYFQLVNASGVYALSYESSDPAVASVDDGGIVTAVSPGEAVVTLRYEGAGGPLEFLCTVHCAW